MKDKAFVLYDSSLPEIRTILPQPDGSLYAAALGGSLSKRTTAATNAITSSSGTPTVTSTSTSITITDDAVVQGGAEIKPKPRSVEAGGSGSAHGRSRNGDR